MCGKGLIAGQVDCYKGFRAFIDPANEALESNSSLNPEKPDLRFSDITIGNRQDSSVSLVIKSENVKSGDNEFVHLACAESSKIDLGFYGQIIVERMNGKAPKSQS